MLLNCNNRCVHYLCDLTNGIIFVVKQNNNRPVRQFQFLYCFPDRQLCSGINSRFWGSQLFLLLKVNNVFSLSDVLNRRVMDNGQYPGAKFIAVFQLIQIAVRFQNRILHHICCVSFVFQNPYCKCVHTTLILPYTLAEVFFFSHFLFHPLPAREYPLFR